jgi:hypothetical protein
MSVSNPASRGDLALYLVGVTGISVASIGILYALFVRGFPAFLSGLGEDPVGAVQADPLTPVLVLAGFALVVLLVVLVVVFGATHAPDTESPET